MPFTGHGRGAYVSTGSVGVRHAANVLGGVRSGTASTRVWRVTCSAGARRSKADAAPQRHDGAWHTYRSITSTRTGRKGRTDMPVPPNVPIDASVVPEPSLPMIPGQRESRNPLTRFGEVTPVVHTTVDVTMDSAGRADRRREGGGAPGERRPARPSRWATLLARLGVRRARATPPPTAPVTVSAVLNPPVL